MKQNKNFNIDVAKTALSAVAAPGNISTEDNKKADEKIIELPIRPRFSADEINSLFLGLCKLVKRIAFEEAEDHCRKRIADVEAGLKRQIKNLQLINDGLIAQLNKKNKTI